MSLMNIRVYPAEVLLATADEIEQITDDIRKLAADMTETMFDTGNGVGLAAPQVGVSKRLVILSGELFDKGKVGVALLNPQIISSEGEEIAEEGCLSLPGLTAPVARASKVEVRAMLLSGKTMRFTCENLAARAIAHEIDHLNGVLFFERVIDQRRREFIKLVKETFAR